MLQHSELPGDQVVPVRHGGHNLWSGFDGWCVCCSILNSLVIVVFLSGMVAITCGVVLMGGVCVAAF